MIISPEFAIKVGWVKIYGDATIQTSDFTLLVTLDNLWGYKDNVCYMSDSNVTGRGYYNMHPIPKRRSGEEYWHMGDSAYFCQSDVYLELPDNAFAVLNPRNYLTENGILLSNTMFEGGYGGFVSFTLLNPLGGLQLKPHTIIGSLTFNEVDPQFIPTIKEEQ